MELYGGASVDVDAAKAVLGSNFTVNNVYFEAGVLTFEVAEKAIKERFKRCVVELKRIGLIATARMENGVVKVRVFPYVKPPKNDVRIPIVLGIATIITVSFDGFLRSTGRIFSLVHPGYGVMDVLFNGLVFSTALLSIIFIHEMGHKLSARIDGVSASHPYFIPGFPGVIPTLGAVIFQKEPLTNRDDMFDIGISGPVAGFITAIAVAIVAFQTATWVPVEQYRSLVEAAAREGSVVDVPLIFTLIRSLYGRPDEVPFFMTVGFAAWLGMVVTALNLMPVWQLDGGRIFRSFLSRRQHVIASYIAIGVLVITGYYFMALLLILMMGRNIDIVPLDDVSPLSFWRKVSLVGLAAMLVLSFVPLNTVF
ncbi:MAG: site-2 protease family protein [Candidatus Caldarchaeum sp.]|nr:site-2 protease family protein [Candidatus Caldarchaeum sp.]